MKTFLIVLLNSQLASRKRQIIKYIKKKKNSFVTFYAYREITTTVYAVNILVGVMVVNAFNNISAI